MITPLRPHTRAARLETLRREYKAQVIASVASYGRTVRVAAHVLTPPGQERLSDLELVSKYTTELGWEVARSTFADVGQPLPLVERLASGPLAGMRRRAALPASLPSAGKHPRVSGSTSIEGVQ